MSIYTVIPDPFINALSDIGWGIRSFNPGESSADICFEATSPLGEEVLAEVNFDGSFDDLCVQVKKSAEAFDVKEHLGVLLTLRGQNGVPVLPDEDFENDCNQIKAMREGLSSLLEGYKNEPNADETFGFSINSDCDLTQIRDALQLDSDTFVAGLRTSKFCADIWVKGEVDIQYAADGNFDEHGESFSKASDYCDGLKALLRDPNIDIWSDPRIYIRNNNWFEVFLYEGPEASYQGFMSSDVVDLEGSTPEELYQFLHHCIYALEHEL